MDTELAVHLVAATLLTAAKVASPVLLTALVIGVIVSILQVVTQIQEMTLTFIPKIVGVVLVLLACGAWMLAVTVEFARHMLAQIAGMEIR